MAVPGLTTSAKSYPRHRRTDEGLVLVPDVVLDSSNTDSGSSPTSLFRPGNVIVKQASTGRFLEANDASGDANEPASVSASETADADWAGKTFTFTVDGGPSFTLTAGGSDDSDAEIVTLFNASGLFQAAGLVADESGSRVRVRTTSAGAHKTLKIESNLATAYGASGTEDSGADAEFLVCESHAKLTDENGTAAHCDVAASWAGDYVEANLINLTAAAKAVLIRRGSRIG